MIAPSKLDNVTIQYATMHAIYPTKYTHGLNGYVRFIYPCSSGFFRWHINNNVWPQQNTTQTISKKKSDNYTLQHPRVFSSVFPNFEGIWYRGEYQTVLLTFENKRLCLVLEIRPRWAIHFFYTYEQRELLKSIRRQSTFAINSNCFGIPLRSARNNVLYNHGVSLTTRMTYYSSRWLFRIREDETGLYITGTPLTNMDQLKF